MTTTAPYGLSAEENAEIDAIFDNEELMAFMSPTGKREDEIRAILANEELLEFMQAGLPNTGKEEPDHVLLERGLRYVDAFAKTPREFWSFK